MTDPAGWSCPLPLRGYPNVVMGHGGGGKLTAELIDHLFLPAFGSDPSGDAAVLTAPGGRLAFTTDSYVVRPLFFPGGSIGELAVNGTVNDLAMSGARPLYLSAGFILEEGLPLATLAEIARRMGDAARAAGVTVVTGDTKVVERGHGDGCYINTSGVGDVPAGVDPGAHRIRPGDRVLVSGTMGDHGMAVLSVREGLEFESPIASDTAPLADLVAVLLMTPGVRAMRDPTRGGMAATLNEWAGRCKLGIAIDEAAVPVDPVVRSACEILGLDPLYVANEGKLIAVVAPESADRLLEAMRRHPLGARAAVVGHVTDQHPGMVVARTGVGGSRVLPLPMGEQLPRIC